MQFKMPPQAINTSRDALILAVVKSDPDRFAGTFTKHDLMTSGGRELLEIMRKHAPLEGIDLLIPREEAKKEAEILLEKIKTIKVDQPLVSLLLKKIPVIRELTTALESGLEIDIPLVSRRLRSLHDVELGETSDPKAGEWKGLIAKAHEAKIETIPTGITTLDQDLEGGIWVGEVGFVMAPSFRGKTWMMVHIGSAAAQAGIPVLHLTPEIVDHRVLVRYAQNTLGVSRSTVLSYSPQTLYRKLRSKWKAPLRITSIRGAKRQMAGIQDEIYQFPTGSLILLDASELVTFDSGSEGWMAAGQMIVALRDTVEELGMSMWTTVQTNRGGMRHDAGMESIAESIRKVWAADVIIAMQQTPGDLATQRMRLQILKARERENVRAEISLIGDSVTQRFLEIGEEEPEEIDDGKFKLPK